MIFCLLPKTQKQHIFCILLADMYLQNRSIDLFSIIKALFCPINICLMIVSLLKEKHLLLGVLSINLYISFDNRYNDRI